MNYEFSPMLVFSTSIDNYPGKCSNQLTMDNVIEAKGIIRAIGVKRSGASAPKESL